MTSSATPAGKVQRQIVLPTSKAVEIAYKSIRLRLSRSLLVTSGIVLALAFLMSIRTTQTLQQSMRDWVRRINSERAASAKALADADTRQLLDERTRQFDGRRAVFSDAQKLEQLMASKGVPTSAGDIDADRVQTRWLLGLALMVAFVGILNAMLMSVTERFREIGTMKCLGALDSFIIKLFLIESLFQGVVGTIIGVILGLAMSLLSAVNNFDGYVWKNIPMKGLAGSAGVCVLIGVGLTVAGAVYPAWQAARMQPIEAMRVET